MTQDLRAVGEHFLRLAERLLKPPPAGLPSVMGELLLNPEALLTALLASALSSEIVDVERPAGQASQRAAEAEWPALALPAAPRITARSAPPPPGLDTVLAGGVERSNPVLEDAEPITVPAGLLWTLAGLGIAPRPVRPELLESSGIQDWSAPSLPALRGQIGEVNKGPVSHAAAPAEDPYAPSGGQSADMSPPTVTLPNPAGTTPDVTLFNPSPELVALADAVTHWTVGTAAEARFDAFAAAPRRELPAIDRLEHPGLSTPETAISTQSNLVLPALSAHSALNAPQPGTPSAARLVRDANGLAGILRANISSPETEPLRRESLPETPLSAVMSAPVQAVDGPESLKAQLANQMVTPRSQQVDVNDVEQLMQRLAEYLEYEYLRMYGTSGGR